jgi:two-component system chemotaxis response regulator CheB
LQVLLRDFPENCPPTIIIQHVKARFTPAIAHMLDSGPGPGRAGRARHKGLGWPYLSVTQMRPAHERERSGRLFHQVTGGASGIRLHAQRGCSISIGGQACRCQRAVRHGAGRCHTIAQDEATCVVFRMPRTAISLSAAALGCDWPSQCRFFAGFSQAGQSVVC